MEAPFGLLLSSVTLPEVFWLCSVIIAGKHWLALVVWCASLKVEFFHHRTLGRVAKVNSKTQTMFFVLDGVWRDADSVEDVLLTKVPGTEWSKNGWLLAEGHEGGQVASS